MPLHLTSITRKTVDGQMLLSLLKTTLAREADTIASQDGRILHVADWLRDDLSGDRIGKVVFTLSQDEKQKTLQLIDVDLTLDGAAITELRFLQKLPKSSDANEYYDVEAVAEGQHLQVETVNRHAVKQRELTDSVQRVRASAFPFRVDVYDDMAALNEALGFPSGPVGETDWTVGGLSDTFAAPGSIAQGELEGEIFSFLVGTVRSVRDVSVDFGGLPLVFTIAQMETALGLLPTVLGREVFRLEKLAPGAAVSMYADVKADFALDQ